MTHSYNANNTLATEPNPNPRETMILQYLHQVGFWKMIRTLVLV